MRLFVSYARTDRPKVDPLAQRLRQAGNDAWLDMDLVGGQVWWDNILHQIRESDAFIAIVSRSSLKSQACRIERQYAARLGKPILPLTIEPLNPGTLPSDISRLQILDYSRPDENTAFALIGAIIKLPTPPPLPVPLPGPPDAPSSYWGNIGDQLHAQTLTLDQQYAIVGRLESALDSTADPAEIPVALDLLSQIQRRPDLYAAVERRIARLASPAGPDDGTLVDAPARPLKKDGDQRTRPLIIRDGDQRYTFDTDFIAGRQGALHVRDEYANNHHVRFQTASNLWYVSDLGSTNGTWLNGRRIHAPQRLKNRDKIRIGRTVLEVELPDK
jgi:hypothetical protein